MECNLPNINGAELTIGVGVVANRMFPLFCFELPFLLTSTLKVTIESAGKSEAGKLIMLELASVSKTFACV
jgi:hypothetical protein